jgi:hypothetical protein
MIVVGDNREFSVKVLHFIFQRKKTRRTRERGQSMVEMALSLPILLLVLAGTLEVGWYYNTYMTLVDATREAARYAADGDIALVDLSDTYADCNADFYYQAACLLKQNMFGVTFNEDEDDIVVSAVTLNDAGQVLWRYPLYCGGPIPPDDPPGYYRLCDSKVTYPSQGWSYQAHKNHAADSRVRSSYFPNDQVEARLPDNMPGTALVIVEIYHVHRQLLGLIPPGMPILPQEIVMHAYTIMPVPSAAPLP